MRLLSRQQFNCLSLQRDNHKCLFCDDTESLDIHHIIDRSLFPNGGYYLENASTLCPRHHLFAEKGVLSCDQIRKKAKIDCICLPEGYSILNNYDKWGNIMTELIKYPRTKHLPGSSIQKGDSKKVVSFEEIKGKHIVIEEKIDGANTGISFTPDCDLKLQCRGHYLEGKGDWPEFDPFKSWANTWKDQLFDILSDRYIMYGEWMSGFHSIYYDLLPHWFMEFDIYDKENKIFLSTDRRKEMTDACEAVIESVLVLESGIYNTLESVTDLVGNSHFISDDAIDALVAEMASKGFSDSEIALLSGLNSKPLMEGLYIKWEEDGEVKGRYKYVRRNFTQTIIDCEDHWANRPTIYNQIMEGRSMYDFKQ